MFDGEDEICTDGRAMPGFETHSPRVSNLGHGQQRTIIDHYRYSFNFGQDCTVGNFTR